MTERRPIVLVEGSVSELPSGDVIPADGVKADRIERRRRSSKEVALRRWNVGVAQRESASADVMWLGDSVTEGYQLASFKNRITAHVLDALRGRYPIPGVQGGDGYVALSQVLGQVPDHPVSLTGGALQLTGLGSRGRLWTGTNSATYTFSNATTVSVLSYQSGDGGAAGTWTWSLDGGATTTITSNTGILQDFVETQIAIPDKGQHTVTIAWGSGAVIVNGFMHYSDDEDEGIRIWEGGHAGGDTARFMSTAARRGYIKNQATRITPSLVVIELGANDYDGMNPVSAATFKANVQTIIQDIKDALTLNPSFLLLPIWHSSPSGNQVDDWGAFVDAMYDIADNDVDVAVFDIGTLVWPEPPSSYSSPESRGMLQADAIHPSDGGVQVIANEIARFLLPGIDSSTAASIPRFMKPVKVADEGSAGTEPNVFYYWVE